MKIQTFDDTMGPERDPGLEDDLVLVSPASDAHDERRRCIAEVKAMADAYDRAANSHPIGSSIHDDLIVRAATAREIARLLFEGLR